MKKLFLEAEGLVKEAQIIADNIFDYNSGLHKEKVPLDALQYSVACLAREFAGLYGKIGEKLKE